MTNENFFKHNDKAYTENMNDAVLIANAFNFEVPLNLPSMYLNKHYPSNTNTYKAGVTDVTIINSGQLSIGDTAITNNASSSQTLRLRVYPNFNSFYAWKSINWTCTGDVTVDICNTGTSTSLIPTGALTDPDNETLLNGISNLQGLKEYDLLITIPENGVLNTLNIVFINNRASENRVSASISQGNVAGLESSLSNLDSAISTGLSNLDSAISTGLSGKVNMTQIIPRSSNLDNYKTTGFYSSEEGISDVAYSNTPTKHGKGFTLLVESIGNRHCKQTFTSFYEPCEMYVRVYYKDYGDYSWRDWRKVAFE